MADEEPQSGRSGLTRRYGPLPAWAWGLLGGVGVYAVYRFVQARRANAAAAAAGTTAGADTGGIDYAPQIATLQAEIQQLQGTEAREHDTDTDRDGGTGPGPNPPPPGTGGRVRVPDVVGQRAAFAISTIEAAGLEAVTAPPRSPRREYMVTGQTPRAGAEVPRRTVVVLRVRLASKPRAPRPRQPAGQGGGPPGGRGGLPRRERL